jgi:hypothetical protein
MAEVAIRFGRATNPSRPIENAADYERIVDSTLIPQVGDWIRFKNAKLRVESRTWSYVDEAANCLLSVDFLGDVL